MKQLSVILDADKLDRALTRIAHEILEHNSGAKKLAIVGIQPRGAHIAKRITDKISEIEKVSIPEGALDISLYRDDISVHKPEVRKTDINFDVTDINIILVDDVLYTGRTVRAAMDALTDFGRAKSIQLAVLIDRGHRELPIRPDYIGKNIPTAPNERVGVKLKEEGGDDSVVLCLTEDK